jgi:preprotein translocase subunit SecA
VRTDALPIPGIVLGAYPERQSTRDDAFTRALRRAQTAMATLAGVDARRYRRFLEQVRQASGAIEAMDRQGVRETLVRTRARLGAEGLTDSLVANAFALVDEACARSLGIRVYESQLIAARIMLENRLAEMATGEGKTIAAGVCAATAALAGIPVHVITANDYLVARDAVSLRPLYAALGLSVGYITQPLDAAGRQRAYACDITYCTAKELVFDYLRDRITKGGARSDLHLRAERVGAANSEAPTLLRGLCMAIVDEADSILIDEARIPLILSDAATNPAQLESCRHALALARQLLEREHYTLDRQDMCAHLTAAGEARLQQSATLLGGVWHNRMHREEAVCTALAALHLFQRDRHYVVRDGKVMIIDETTGRLAAGRVWSRGLHQSIEFKEACEPSSELVTAAQITYQRFFPRYLRLAGMSGTLREAHGELQSVYGLPLVGVPLRRPCRRRLLPTRVYRHDDAQQRAVVARAAEVIASGRPVLIGTDSVAASEMLSQRLTQAGLPHSVLNAHHDQQEAQIIARAGQPGQITVATNMAGRGTDIVLGAGVADLGGLHLVCCQHNASRRIDRQFVGRSARQGDPGSSETYISLEQPLISRFVPHWIRGFVPLNGMFRPAWLIALIVRVPQRLEERRQRAQRRALLKQDARLERDLTIGAPAE